jgi:hypothetical protein
MPSDSYTLTISGLGVPATHASTHGVGASDAVSISATQVTAGTLAVARGGTGAATLTGYVKGTGTTAMTANSTVPVGDISGTLPVASGGTGVTSSTGSGSNVLSISPTLVTPVLGTPSSGTLTSCTGLPLSTGITGTLPIANGGTANDGTAVTAITFDTQKFKTSGQSSGSLSMGQQRWNNTNYTLDLQLDGITQQVGQQQNIRVKNVESFSLTTGMAVYIFGADSATVPTVKVATSVNNLANKTVGIVANTITSNSYGYITLTGMVTGLDNVSGLTTSGMNAGDEIWLATGGTWSTTQQTFIRSQIKLGHVINASPTTGSIMVNPRIIAGPAGTRVGGIISTNSTEVATTVTSTVTPLNSYTIVATAFRANGTIIKGSYRGQITGTNLNRQITATFNGSTIFDSTAFNPNAAGDWKLDLELSRVDATSLDIFATLHCHNQPVGMRTTQYTRLTSLALDSADYALVVNGLTTSVGSNISTNQVIHRYSAIYWDPTGV